MQKRAYRVQEWGMGRGNVKKRMETFDVKGDLDYVGSEKKVYRTLDPNKSTRASEHEGQTQGNRNVPLDG